MATSQTRSRILSREVRNRLELATDVAARLDRPNLPAARESVAAFRDCFRAMSAHARLEGDTARLIDLDALYRSFDALLAFRVGDAGQTASVLLDAWSSTTRALLPYLEDAQAEILATADSVQGGIRASQDEIAESPPVAAPPVAGLAERAEWLILFYQAVEQVVASELGVDQARGALRSLMARLELSQDDIGRLFGVSGETVRRWERGLTAIPARRGAEILAAGSSLRRLQDLFRPERLATAIRRPAELFDGETALEWILRGRISEVADHYERALLYQA